MFEYLGMATANSSLFILHSSLKRLWDYLEVKASSRVV